HTDGKRGKQRQQFISPGAKSVGQNATSFRVVRVPEPVLSRFTADKTPLLIKFADECHISMSDRG
ncbi:hypothetical protein ECDEC3E_2028, partial [Escherichia coli DEC3E]